MESDVMGQQRLDSKAMNSEIMESDVMKSVEIVPKNEGMTRDIDLSDESRCWN